MQEMQALPNSLIHNGELWHVVKKRGARLARKSVNLHVLQHICMKHIQPNRLINRLLNNACISCMRFGTFIQKRNVSHRFTQPYS